MFHCSCGTGNSKSAPDPPLPAKESKPSASPSVAVKYLTSPDYYKFKMHEQPLPYLGYLKDLSLGRPPDYHEASAAPYPMRARLKYSKPRDEDSDREAEYCYHNPVAHPRWHRPLLGSLASSSWALLRPVTSTIGFWPHLTVFPQLNDLSVIRVPSRLSQQFRAIAYHVLLCLFIYLFVVFNIVFCSEREIKASSFGDPLLER